MAAKNSFWTRGLTLGLTLTTLGVSSTLVGCGEKDIEDLPNREVEPELDRILEGYREQLREAWNTARQDAATQRDQRIANCNGNRSCIREANRWYDRQMKLINGLEQVWEIFLTKDLRDYDVMYTLMKRLERLWNLLREQYPEYNLPTWEEALRQMKRDMGVPDALRKIPLWPGINPNVPVSSTTTKQQAALSDAFEMGVAKMQMAMLRGGFDTKGFQTFAFQMLADTTGDGSLDDADIATFFEGMASGKIFTDFNADGVPNADDATIYMEFFTAGQGR